jgi:hypothetical protein
MKLLQVVSLVAVASSLSFAKPVLSNQQADIALDKRSLPEVDTVIFEKRAPEPTVEVEGESHLEARGGTSFRLLLSTSSS